MFIIHFLVAFFVALFITGLFLLVFHRQRRCPVFIFFLIVFLGTWVGGVWMVPIGPTIWNVYWMPFFFAGLIFALLLAAALPMGSFRFRSYNKKQLEKEKVAKAVLRSFFWVLIISLIVGIFIHYILGYHVSTV